MCSPSAVASKAWYDASHKWGSRVTYLGIVGDQAHSVRVSGHNCGALQESSLVHPDTGVLWAYPDEFAHALDIGHGGNRALAAEIRNAFLNDPYKRVRYVIDNGVIYYPAWRGGGTDNGSGHESHVHVSFTPWSTNDIRPFFSGGAPSVQWPLKRGDTGFAVVVLEINLVHAGYPHVVVDGKYGIQTKRAVTQMQRFLKLPANGQVNEKTFEAIGNWVNFVGKADIKTLTDHGPKVAKLRRDLHKIGQAVPAHGNRYDQKVQKAVQNVQRFFDGPVKSGNATKEDREFIAELAEKA